MLATLSACLKFMLQYIIESISREIWPIFMHPFSREQSAARKRAVRRKSMNVPVLIALCFFLTAASPAAASQGDVLAAGTVYQAATYIDHPKYGTHPSFYGNPPEQVVDINIGTNSFDDDGLPVFAPEDGTVRVVYDNTNAWGYAVEWENTAGTERLFMAHLKSIFVQGAVLSGEQIGEIGGTGGWKPHLHIESSQGWVELSGRKVVPLVNPKEHGAFYLSKGPLAAENRTFFTPLHTAW